MSLTTREKQILDLIRRNPLLSAASIANTLGTTGASVAVHLSNLTKKGWLLGRGFIVRDLQNVVVLGGANMDFKHHLFEKSVMQTSNPGLTQSVPGGVGRNVAHNLAQMGVRVELISVIGLDRVGEQLMTETSVAGVHLEHVKRSQTPTGTYTAVLEPNGELLIAIAAMDILEELTPGFLQSKQAVFEQASLIVLDCNLPESSLTMMVRLASERAWKLLIEPVSVPKARKLLPALKSPVRVYGITPNQDELEVLVQRRIKTDEELLAACQELHSLGIEHVWVRLGARGSLFSSIESQHWIAGIKSPVVDVTGAGDAALAGFIFASLNGESLERACQFGHAAAALTISSPHTVNPELNALSLKETQSQANPASPLVSRMK